MLLAGSDGDGFLFKDLGKNIELHSVHNSYI
jgi:hypothetical protein